MTELEQEKALHQLAVARANRACERADAAEAERDALREALARVKEVRDWYARTSVGDGAYDIARRDAVKHLDTALAQPATDEGAEPTDEGWLASEVRRARERAASVPPHARPAIHRPATDEGAGA